MNVGGRTHEVRLGEEGRATDATKVTRTFSWPLAKGVTAELRLTGDDIRPDHLERLRQYLELAKAAVASDGGN